jgi:two-component system sensor histidine kinase KdpD
VDEEADRLNNLVSDAIQMLRIEGREFKLNLSSVSVSDLIDAVTRQMRPRMADRPVNVCVAPGLPPVSMDRDLVQLALRQLIDNAIKYSPPRSPVQIGAGLHEGRLKLWVADDGPGVPRPEIERVFERFYRGNSARHAVPGSGLGLSVVREIAHAHGGDAAALRPRQGSRFEIMIPVSERQPGDISAHPRG